MRSFLAVAAAVSSVASGDRSRGHSKGTTVCTCGASRCARTLSTTRPSSRKSAPTAFRPVRGSRAAPAASSSSRRARTRRPCRRRRSASRPLAAPPCARRSPRRAGRTGRRPSRRIARRRARGARWSCRARRRRRSRPSHALAPTRTRARARPKAASIRGDRRPIPRRPAPRGAAAASVRARRPTWRPSGPWSRSAEASSWSRALPPSTLRAARKEGASWRRDTTSASAGCMLRA
jgi:hypothetical protein